MSAGSPRSLGSIRGDRTSFGSVITVQKSNQGSLLVVDDDKQVCQAMADYLRSLGHRTETAFTCLDAIERMGEFPFQVVLCDVCLPDADGFHLLQWAVEHAPNTDVILITGYGTIESAVEAIRMGAFDYLTKPVIDAELNLSIQRALSQRKIVDENRSLRAQLDDRFGLKNVVGRDYKMLRLFDLVESVADTRTTILILGESGTGKTVTARAIHQLSSRREQAVCRSLLRGAPRFAVGKRTVRPRRGRLHRCDARQGRQVPAGRRRHDLPRRNRHRLAQLADQTAPRAAGPRIRAGGRDEDPQSRRPADPGHQSRPRADGPPRANSAKTCIIAST